MHLEIYDAKHLVIDHAVLTRPREVKLYEFDLFNDAYRTFYIDGEEYTGDADCVLCRKPGQIVHSNGTYDNLLLTLQLRQDGCNDPTFVNEDLLCRFPTLFYPTHINELKQMLRKIIQIRHDPKQAKQLEQELHRFLLLLLSDSFEETPLHAQKQPSRITKITSYIQQHYAEKISIEDLAALIHLDKYYFIKYFKRKIGMTPQQYLIQKRIREAKALLESLDLPIREISYMVGYANTTHFVASFTKIVGISPAQYRAGFRLPTDALS